MRKIVRHSILLVAFIALLLLVPAPIGTRAYAIESVYRNSELAGSIPTELYKRPPKDVTNETCNGGGRKVGPTSAPTPFLYKPFAADDIWPMWASQMDHVSPNYAKDGVVATLGEKLRYSDHSEDPNHPHVGGTEAWRKDSSGSELIPYTSKPWVAKPQSIYFYQSYFFNPADFPGTGYLGYDGHDGQDFGTTGDALAAADGVVIFAGDNGDAFGNVVEIAHLRGLAPRPQAYLTRYAHLAKTSVSKGDTIQAGQPVGVIGGTPYWAVHLHFSTYRWEDSRQKWQITDPFSWDPWLESQEADPLTGCNGEVSYNLWVGGWPRPVTTQKAALTEAEPGRPLADRYLGGWWGENAGPPNILSDAASYISDVNYADGSFIAPSQSLTKIWRMKNNGNSTWGNGYQLVFRSGHRLGAPPAVDVPATAQGQTADISVPLQIPGDIQPGTYRGNWQMRNPQGTFFGDTIYYILVVPGGQPPAGNAVGGSTADNLITIVAHPGERLDPEINFTVTSGQLRERDMLRFKSGKNLTQREFPHVEVSRIVNIGETHGFRFYADHPLIAPNEPGTYDGVWQVWANNGWVQPEYTIRVVVNEPDQGRPPYTPTNTSPYDWQVFVGNGPTLCAQDNGDPDGDAITAYRFVAWNSVSPTWDSGWVSSNCIATSNLANEGYTWHVQVRDSRGLESGFGPDWHFGVQSATASFTDIHFDPPGPSGANMVLAYACTQGAAGVGVELMVKVNTATDGSANGEWKEIKTLGVPCFNMSDVPEWDTLEFADGVHLVRFQAKSPNGTTAVEDRQYTLTRRQPSRPFQLSPSHQFWTNSRTIPFRWQAAVRATNYTLIVNTSPNSEEGQLLNVTLDDTEYIATFDQDYPRLYWHVFANNELGRTVQGGRWVGIDRTAAQSAINTTRTLPVSYETQFLVSWDGSDGDSGVLNYDIQMRQGNTGPWLDWLLAYPYSSAIFSGQPGNTYQFRSRAHDVAGNTEAYPADPDASVNVDPTQRPPETWWDSGYGHKRNLVINNPSANVVLPANYTVHLRFDDGTSPTAAEIFAASLAANKGDDVRIVHNNSTELPRHIATFSASAIDIWFPSAAPIDPSGSSTLYQIYYGNGSASNPPAEYGNVFQPMVDANTVAAWYYEDGQGSQDSSGQNHNLNWQSPGTVDPSYGLSGQGIRLTGVPVGSAMAGTPVGDYLTVETWIYFEGPIPTNIYTELLNKRNPENNGDRWGIRIQSCGNTPCIRASIEVMNTTDQYAFGLDWNETVQPDRWYHIAMTYDGNVGRLWINGVNVDTRNAPNSRVRDDGQPINIGRYQTSSHVIWRMDGTRISNVARTSFDYGRVQAQPAVAAGEELGPQTAIESTDLLLRDLTSYTDDEGNLLVEAVVENTGAAQTYNEVYINLHKNHVPTGPGDTVGTIGFWVNSPIAPGATITVSTVITPGQLGQSGLTESATADQLFSLAGQADATGSVLDEDRSNNIVSGITACLAGVDAFEGDDARTSARLIQVGQTQTHNFNSLGDEDWLKFMAQAGKDYLLRTSTLGSGADTYLYLYDVDGTTLLAANDDSADSLASAIGWRAPADGTYLLKVAHWNPGAGGCATSYDLAVLTPSNVIGQLAGQGRVEGARPLTVSLSLQNESLQRDYPGLEVDSRGVFTLPITDLQAGVYEWQAKSPRYLSTGGNMTLVAGDRTTLDIGTLRAGDANDDDLVDVGDFAVLRSSFGRTAGDGGYDDRGDFNGDQIVDVSDFSLLRSNFGSGGGQASNSITRSADAPSSASAYLELRPAGGSPTNGGMAKVGDKVRLELWLNTGAAGAVVAQQSYLTFTQSGLRNVTTSGAGCTAQAGITADVATFESVLLNGACNAAAGCGSSLPPGELAFASGALAKPATGGSFRLGEITLCATAPGEARLHWQLAPSAVRSSKIVDTDGNRVEDARLFVDYVLQISPTDGTAVPSLAPGFSDVSAGDYFYDAVQYLAARGVVSGYGDGTFRPYNTTTRGQLAKIVVGAAGWDIDTNSGPHFSDVPEENVFYRYIETAMQRGIVSGYSDGTFRPTEGVTRGQLSKIVVLAQSWSTKEVAGPHFSDVPEESPFYSYIELAYARGVISGYADGTFRPSSSATRGQIAKIVYNSVIAP